MNSLIAQLTQPFLKTITQVRLKNYISNIMVDYYTHVVYINVYTLEAS